MRQKIRAGERTGDTSRTSVARRGGTSRRKKRSALYWKACTAMTVSPSPAAARGSSRNFITAGRKTFSRRGRSDWLARAATSDEVRDPRREAGALKEVVAELTLENRLLKKSVTADGEGAT
jgi:transposase